MKKWKMTFFFLREWARPHCAANVTTSHYVCEASQRRGSLACVWIGSINTLSAAGCGCKWWWVPAKICSGKYTSPAKVSGTFSAQGTHLVSLLQVTIWGMSPLVSQSHISYLHINSIIVHFVRYHFVYFGIYVNQSPRLPLANLHTPRQHHLHGMLTIVWKQ